MAMGSISSFFSFLGNAIWNLWDKLREFLSTTWGLWVLLSGLAYAGMHLIGNMAINAVTMLLSALGGDGGVSPGISQPSGLTEVLAIGNTFFPLDETCKMMAAMLVYVWLPIGIYRLIKSWLPAGFAGGS